MSSDFSPASKRPPRQSRKGLTSTGARKAASKSARSRAREFALQALYQHIVGRNEATSIDLFTRDLAGFHKADAAHYDALLHGCVRTEADLDALIVPQLDRPLAEISPIEHAVYDEGSRMLKGFLAGLAAHLEPGGEGWLILSDLAEHLGLRPREQLLAWIAEAGLVVRGRHDVKPVHAKAADFQDALHAARAAEVTSLWRLAAA